MTQSNLIQLAQAGDVNAISALMNSALQAIGVTARVVLREGDLHILLESEQALAENSCIEFIRRGITRLGLAWLSSAIVYSRIAGEQAPAWVQKIDLATTELANPFVLTADASVDADTGVLRRLPIATPRRVRLFDLLMLSVPLLIVFSSIQIWSRYLANAPQLSLSPNAGSTVSGKKSTASKSGESAKPDLYYLATNKALSAVKKGETAKTRQEWRSVVDEWQQAIAQLKGIPKTHPKYAIVQQRLATY